MRSEVGRGSSSGKDPIPVSDRRQILGRGDFLFENRPMVHFQIGNHFHKTPENHQNFAKVGDLPVCQSNLCQSISFLKMGRLANWQRLANKKYIKTDLSTLF